MLDVVCKTQRVNKETLVDETGATSEDSPPQRRRSSLLGRLSKGLLDETGTPSEDSPPQRRRSLFRRRSITATEQVQSALNDTSAQRGWMFVSSDVECLRHRTL